MVGKISFLLILLLFLPFNVCFAHIHSKPGTVALTFDDGPRPKYTQQILEILDRYHIKATFFVLGQNAKRYPNLIKAIKAHGEVIANHTMTHPFLTRLNDPRLHDEVVGPNIIIKKITGETPVCLRPPYGVSNERVRHYIRSQGMQVVMWDLNSFDYKRQSIPHLIHWVLSKTKPGYLILMHDGNGHSFQTVKALPAIIEGLRKRGIGFAVICQS